MQLTSHTDYALRTLMVLGVCAPEKIRTQEIATAFDISEHHLAKVIQNLARLGYIETIRGKDGGIRLAQAPCQINVGKVVREMEKELGVVPCLSHGGQECFITPVCGLKGILKNATEAFLAHLDAVTLQQLLGPQRGKAALQKALEGRMPELVQLRLA